MIVTEFSDKYFELAGSFDCGNVYLNNFLTSSSALDPGISKTYIALSDDKTNLIGYYSIDCGAVDQVVGNYHEKIGGAVHLRCFALDKQYQHELQEITPSGRHVYVSDILLEDCLERVDYIRLNFIGVEFVTLASTREGEKLYRRHGFDDLDEDISFSTTYGEDECICLYLPLDFE